MTSRRGDPARKTTRCGPAPSVGRNPRAGSTKSWRVGQSASSGEVIEVGWYAYYWLPDTMRFEAVLIQD